MIIGVEGRNLQGNRLGVGRYLVNVLRELATIDQRNEYIIYHSQPIEPLGFTSDRIRYDNPGRAPSILWRHLRLPLAMRRDGIDLHFSPSYFLPLLKVCPSVVAVHDIIFKVHPEWFIRDRRLLFDGLFIREVKRAERITTLSHHSKRDIVNVLNIDPAKVVVIPIAADELFRPIGNELLINDAKKRHGIDDGFVFTVGSVHTRRNLVRLIEAISLASGRLGRDLKLLIVGEPAPFRPPIDLAGTAHSYGLDDQVIHVEYISDEDLLLLYNACDLFVYPSLYEGFGLPVIEAMACGTPVACSNATSLPEVAGKAAVYFDPTDAGDMANAMIRILDDSPLKEKLSRAGIERASTFSWRRTAEETLKVFEEVLG